MSCTMEEVCMEYPLLIEINSDLWIRDYRTLILPIDIDKEIVFRSAAAPVFDTLS
jgi:hypothetical protein